MASLSLLIFAAAAMLLLVQSPASASRHALEEELALEEMPAGENYLDDEYYGGVPYRLERRGFLHSGRLGRRGMLPSHQLSKKGFLTASRLG